MDSRIDMDYDDYVDYDDVDDVDEDDDADDDDEYVDEEDDDADLGDGSLPVNTAHATEHATFSMNGSRQPTRDVAPLLEWSEVASSLRRYWTLLLPIALVALVLAVTVGQAGADTFRSEVDLVFAPSPDLPETYETVDALDTLRDRVLQGTYIELTESRTLRTVAVAAGRLNTDLADDANVIVTGAIAQEANIVTVTVDAPSSDGAAALNAALADATIERFEGLYPIITVAVVDNPTVPEDALGADTIRSAIVALMAALLLWAILAVVVGRIRS